MSFYCEKYVGRGRTTKYCECCGKTIHTGTGHYVIPVGMFESNIVLCLACHKLADEHCDSTDDLWDFIEHVQQPEIDLANFKEASGT